MSTETSPLDNDALAALSEVIAPSFWMNVTQVEFNRGDVISDAAEYVYFPVDCLVGQINSLREGIGSAVFLMGRDSMVGCTLLLGSDINNSRFLVQCSGTAFRMPAAGLVRQFNDCEAVREVLLKFIHASMLQMAETAVCNQRHTMEEQLCRWILMSLDRLPEHKWGVPQDMAVMMGLSHEGFRDAALQLERLGAIQYLDTGMVMVNRALIEAMCCPCYATGPRAEQPMVENDDS